MHLNRCTTEWSHAPLGVNEQASAEQRIEARELVAPPSFRLAEPSAQSPANMCKSCQQRIQTSNLGLFSRCAGSIEVRPSKGATTCPIFWRPQYKLEPGRRRTQQKALPKQLQKVQYSPNPTDGPGGNENNPFENLLPAFEAPLIAR